MEKLNDIHKLAFEVLDFESYPVWVWDDENIGFHPLSDVRSLPEEFGTLFVSASFQTPTGKKLKGYLVDVDSVYAFGLFWEGEEFVVNMNVPDLSILQIKKLEDVVGVQIMPLHYEANIIFDDFRHIEGVIESIE